MKAQVSGSQIRSMTQEETLRAVARDDRLNAHRAWRAMHKITGGTRQEFRFCGSPLSHVDRRYEPRKGVWNSAHRAVMSCNDVWCPRCGHEVALRRWAMLILAMDRHVRSGGFMVFVSVAGQHSGNESFADKYARWRWVSDWLPGKGAGPGKVWMAQNGIEAYVKIAEATVGGQNGAGVGGHYIFFCRLPEGSDDRAEWVAADMGRRLQQGLGDFVMHRALRYGEQHHADVFSHFMSDVAFHSRLAGVSEISSYAVKLADGAGIGGAASEMTDPTGTKLGQRNIGMRGLPVHIGRETVRLSYKSPHAAIRSSEDLTELVEQYAEIRRVMRGKHQATWSASQRLFTEWREADTPTLVELAMAVIAEEDPVGAAVAAELLESTMVDQEQEVADEDDPFDEPAAEPDQSDAGARAFYRGVDEEGSVDHSDDSYFVTVSVGEEVAREWVDSLDDPMFRDVDLEMVRALDAAGPWRHALALGDACRRATGEAVYVYERPYSRDPSSDVFLPRSQRPEILVTNDEDCGWDEVPWWEVKRRAQLVPKRVRAMLPRRR